MKQSDFDPTSPIIEWGRAGLEALKDARFQLAFAVAVLMVLLDVIVTIFGGLDATLRVAIYALTLLAVVVTLIVAVSSQRARSRSRRASSTLMVIVLLIVALFTHPTFAQFSEAVARVGGVSPQASPTPPSGIQTRQGPVLNISDLSQQWTETDPNVIGKDATVGTLQPCKTRNVVIPPIVSKFAEAFAPYSGAPVYNEADKFPAGQAAQYVSSFDQTLSVCSPADRLATTRPPSSAPEIQLGCAKADPINLGSQTIRFTLLPPPEAALKAALVPTVVMVQRSDWVMEVVTFTDPSNASIQTRDAIALDILACRADSRLSNYLGLP